MTVLPPITGCECILKMGRHDYIICHQQVGMHSNTATDGLDSQISQMFQPLRKMGQGAYGQVWKVRNKKTGAIRALKKVFQAFGNSTSAQRTYRQVRYLQKISHPNILKLHQVYGSINQQDLYMELEWMDADLSAALKNKVLLTIHKQFIFYQIVNALHFLHAAQIIHRDIKSANVLLNQACEVRLCDFGFVRSVGSKEVMTEHVATRWYRAPEILLGVRKYGKQVDVWGLGCILAQMVLHQPIFKGTSSLDQLQKIFEVTGKPQRKDLPFLTSKDAWTMIDQMPGSTQNRLKQVVEADQHTIDLLQAIFKLNPSQRPTIDEIFTHPLVAKFRGRVLQKLPEQVIKISHQNTKFAPEQFRFIVFEDNEDKIAEWFNSRKKKQIDPSIFRTVPTKVKNSQKKPWSPQKKSPLNITSTMNRDTKKMITEQREEIKSFRRSPSFLKNKQKSKSPLKEPTPQKVQPQITGVTGITSVKEMPAKGNRVANIPGINILKVERAEAAKFNPQSKLTEVKTPPSVKQLKVESPENYARQTIKFVPSAVKKEGTETIKFIKTKSGEGAFSPKRPYPDRKGFPMAQTPHSPSPKKVEKPQTPKIAKKMSSPSYLKY